MIESILVIKYPIALEIIKEQFRELLNDPVHGRLADAVGLDLMLVASEKGE